MLVSKTIKASEFNGKDKYQEFSLKFSAENIKHYKDNVLGIEFRILWHGTIDLAVDRITVG